MNKWFYGDSSIEKVNMKFASENVTNYTEHKVNMSWAS